MSAAGLLAAASVGAPSAATTKTNQQDLMTAGQHQQFCLKWNNHTANLIRTYSEMFELENFVDVTLACDGYAIKAHKTVLSANSNYFKELFMMNPCKHPIVILKDMKFDELRAIVDFMYRGEVNVSQAQLGALLRTAEILRVKGLTEVNDNQEHSSPTMAGNPDVKGNNNIHFNQPPPNNVASNVQPAAVLPPSSVISGTINGQMNPLTNGLDAANCDLQPSLSQQVSQAIMEQQQQINQQQQQQQQQPPPGGRKRRRRRIVKRIVAITGDQNAVLPMVNNGNSFVPQSAPQPLSAEEPQLDGESGASDDEIGSMSNHSAQQLTNNTNGSTTKRIKGDHGGGGAVTQPASHSPSPLLIASSGSNSNPAYTSASCPPAFNVSAASSPAKRTPPTVVQQPQTTSSVTPPPASSGAQQQPSTQPLVQTSTGEMALLHEASISNDSEQWAVQPIAGHSGLGMPRGPLDNGDELDDSDDVEDDLLDVKPIVSFDEGAGGSSIEHSMDGSTTGAVNTQSGASQAMTLSATDFANNNTASGTAGDTPNTPGKICVCHLCHLTFTAYSSPRRHMARHYADRERYECDICFKSYSRKDYLKEHKKLKHAMN